MLAMDTLSYLEEPLPHRMKVERNLNFATLPNDEDDFGFSRKKTARDPMSHRIIEKRRRDRMNNCLADLSRLVPTNYLKKGRGRIEKTEIIEMAIKHLKHLQAHPCKDPGSCEVAKATEQDHKRQFRQGYQECMSETMKFMMEVEGSWIGDGVGIRLINHLQKHYDKLSGGLCYTQALNLMASEESKSAVLHMEVDNHSSSCFPPETNGALLHTEHNGNHPPPAPVNHYYEGSGRVGSNHHTEVAPQPPELKHEADTNGHHHHHLDATSNHNQQQQQPPTSKVTSQLREMLQNPGLPKDPSRCPSSPNHHHNHQQVSPASSAASNHSHHDSSSKGEEVCYKFKNNIKHRFNADLRHHTASPTDSSHLSDEEKPLQPISSEDRPPVPAPPVLLCGGSSSSFSPYAASELSVQAHWDSHVETASSCGSNPSPPPNAGGGGGSSSGYSTNGDTSHRVGSKGGGPSPHSPALSPSGSPQPGVVPVFALHPKGTFYIPLTVEASLLVPYMVGLIDETSPPVLHPVSICVNLGAHSVKVGGHHHNPFQPRPFLMDKFHQDRFVYSDRHLFYSGSPPPTKNGCA